MHQHSPLSSRLGAPTRAALALLLLAAPGASAQGSASDSTLSAPVSNLHYEVGADRAGLAMRRVDSTAALERPASLLLRPPERWRVASNLRRVVEGLRERPARQSVAFLDYMPDG